jgi:regulator of cell morphogenesis and NO signaling
MATETQSIREIISSHPTAAAVLQRFDIDVCAHANEPLSEACAGLQLSLEQVLEKLKDDEIAGSGLSPEATAEMSPSRLIQHIVRVHHRNVRQELPRLTELAGVVAAEFGARMPELAKVAKLLEELRSDMSEHIRKEEQVLFPYIAQLDESPLLAFRPLQQCFNRVGQPIFMMSQEHEHAKRLVDELCRQTNNFKPPVWACATFLALYEGLRSFSGQLQEHVRLENELLFPQALAMEAELMRGGAQ